MHTYPHLALLALLFIGCAEKKPDVTITITRSPYTFEECRAFWDRHLSPIVEKQIGTGTIPYPEINDTYRKNSHSVASRLGKLTVSLSTNYHAISTLIEGSSGLQTNNNAPVITLYIPSIIDRHKSLKATGRPEYEEVFKTHMLVLYMHELDHLAHGPGTNVATHVDAYREAFIWSKTVEGVIAPLFEHHHALILGNEWQMYNAWTNAGRNANSPLWINAVREAYKEVDGKTMPKP